MSLQPTVWSAELATGIIWQDHQHQALLHSLRELHASIYNQTDRHQIKKTFAFLEHYFVEHFGLEEKYMAIHNYPEARYHQAEHESFRKSYLFLQESYRNPSDLSAVLLCYDLNEWIVNHLKTTDRELAAFLKGK